MRTMATPPLPIATPSGFPTLTPRYGAVVVPIPSQSLFGIRVDGPAPDELRLHPRYARLELQDSAGRSVSGKARFRFDPCIAYPMEYGPYRHATLPNYWIGFTFTPSSLPAGMYRIVATFEPGFVTAPGGQQISEDIRFGRAWIRVYLPPPSESPPSLRPGQRFIGLPTIAQPSHPFTGVAGAVVRASTFVGRVVTLERADGARLQFRIDGIDAPMFLARPRDAVSIPGLYPLVEDSTVRRLRAAYLGRQVWGYGGLLTRQPTGGGYLGWDPLRIDGIYRADGYAESIGIGSPGFWSVDLASDFVAINPIVVTFNGQYFVLADAWDFERTYSLRSMQQVHPNWSESTLADIKNHTVKLGMTKEMIAWMFGYPATFGSLDEVRELDTWAYDAPTPAQYTVHFHGGVVVKYDPPRMLP